MNSILLYLVQVIVGSGILYCYYHWVLRNREFHQYNRFYLLSAAVISLLLPLLQIPVYFENTNDASAQMLQAIRWGGDGGNVVVTSDSAGSFFSFPSVLQYSYFLVGGILLLRFAIALFKIIKLLRQHPVEKLEGIDFVNTEEPGTPFTFFRWLFWDRSIRLDSENGRQVFRHEVYHIQQKHSWDVMLMELLRTLFWINPFYHLMKKELRAIHEFLADRFAISEQEKWSYAEFLLMQALQTKNKLVNPFFHSQIKRRIAMITQSKKTSHRYLRKVLALPLAALVLGLVAFQVKQQVDKPAATGFAEGSVMEEVLPAVEEQPAGIVANDTTPKQLKFTLRSAAPETRDSSFKLRGIETGGKEPLFVVDGIVISATNRLRLDTLSSNRIENVTVLKNSSATALYGDAGENGVVVVTTRDLPAEKESRSIGSELNSNAPLQEVKVVGYPLKINKVSPANRTNPEELKEVVVVGYSSNSQTSAPLFLEVEVAPQPRGGQEGWSAYLQKNLNANIGVENHAPLGVYTVKIRFIVEEDGSVSQVFPLTMHGYGMEEEAVRVIKNSGDWEPAKQNGKTVRAFRQQPITFVVQKEKANAESTPSAKTPLMLSLPGREARSSGTIYPNPADQNCTITYKADEAGTALVQVITMAGESTGVQKKVALQKGNNSISLSTAPLKTGTYIVNVVVENNKGSFYKLVKN